MASLGDAALLESHLPHKTGIIVRYFHLNTEGNLGVSWRFHVTDSWKQF